MQPVALVSELDEAGYMRRMLGLHPGLVYVRNPHIGNGVRQWVVADIDACISAALLVWRKYVTVICAGAKGVMVAGRRRGDRDAVVEVWEDKQLKLSGKYPSQQELAVAIAETYRACGADEIAEDE